MRHSPRYIVEDPEWVKDLVRGNPWATIVSPAAAGLVGSHYPVILDPAASGGEIVLVSHVGRPDDELHELGEHEVLVVIQGPHAYISPSVYGNGENVPTWDHLTAHLYGVPEVLSDEENYAMLSALTEHFEAGRDGGRSLSQDEEGARRLAKGTRGFRLRVTRFEARAKLSQNKPPEVMARIAEDLEARYPLLAAAIRAEIPA
ncbi:MAG: FMN-binding negative transcriptional regulator [Microbacteriaceae bacterium]|nr:FMN-binding negative transcriptional regulator [Microbacteriaceae bacterium]